MPVKSGKVQGTCESDFHPHLSPKFSLLSSKISSHFTPGIRKKRPATRDGEESDNGVTLQLNVRREKQYLLAGLNRPVFILQDRFFEPKGRNRRSFE